MIKLKDLLNEAQLSKYQIFAPGTGGLDKGSANMRFNPEKVPRGRLKVYSMFEVNGNCFNKPWGVFWTSSYKQKFKGSAWTDFKKKRFPKWHSSMGAVFELQSGAKILKIKSHSDYMKVQKKFPFKTKDAYFGKCGAGDMYLDWTKVSKVYDGFQMAGSQDSIPMLGQWDVESTAWFNMKKLEFVGTTKV